MLSTITGGVINENSITGFATGINTLFSTVDMFGNYVTNISSISDGILATDGSFLNMKNNGMLVIGGMNTFTNTYDGASINMHLVNSLFEMDEGTNIFDITSASNPGAYHIYGTFPEMDGYNSKQLYNCFKLDGLTIEDPVLPTYSITMGGNPVTLNFIPYQCWAPSFNGNTIVDIGNGLYDTIANVGGGEGGSYSSIKKKLTIANAKTLFDSISIQIRHKNYNRAKDNCYELIGNYPDSIQSLEVLSTLYLSVISSDTTTAAMNELKPFYENLILNNSDNPSMVTNCNYLIQKCKVRLRQYQSALSGFQQIINNNPYSYMGLLARWDYMATSLLISGQGGAYRGENEEGDDDKSPFTKEQSKVIKVAIGNVNETNKNNDEVKIKRLEEKSETGDIVAVKELKTLKILKDVIKSQRPKDIFDHIRIVNNDIQTVFSKDIKVSSKQQYSIPTVFSLSQNYPNPFNPVTTIKYALPHDVKVVVKIYDILGREVKILVNELQKAGYYDAKFDGSNFASGVYFYRIEAGDFVLAKKMVLVK